MQPYVLIRPTRSHPRPSPSPQRRKTGPVTRRPYNVPVISMMQTFDAPPASQTRRSANPRAQNHASNTHNSAEWTRNNHNREKRASNSERNNTA